MLIYRNNTGTKINIIRLCKGLNPMQNTLIYNPNNSFAGHRTVTVIPNSDEIKETSNSKTPELKLFWVFILMVAALPMIKSAVFNGLVLTRNMTSSVRLTLQEHKLLQDTNELESKITEAQSEAGLVRSIKEEIKAIGKNEILIRIIK